MGAERPATHAFVPAGCRDADRRGTNPRTPSRPLGGQIEDALAKGNPDTARMLVPKFLAEPNVSADTLLRTGVNLAQHELFPEATDVFARCVKDHPALFEGYYNLALAELALRKYPVALATIQNAPPASRPEEVARTYLRGKIELALGQNAQAEQDLAAAFAAAPQEENYALDLGLAYIRARKYQPAVEVFEKAGSFQKDSPFLLLGLSLAQFLGGQNAESIETCHTVLSLHPDFSPVRVLLAFALTMQGNVDEAAQVAAQGLHDPAALSLSLLHPRRCAPETTIQGLRRHSQGSRTRGTVDPRVQPVLPRSEQGPPKDGRTRCRHG